MSTKNPTKKTPIFPGAILDEASQRQVSPKKLPYYDGDGGSEELEAAFDIIYGAPKPEDFYKAISLLVFHAQHFSPIIHSELAELLCEPYKRRAGKPVNLELAKDALDYVIGKNIKLISDTLPNRSTMVANLAKKFETNKAIAGRAMRWAEREYKKSILAL